MKKQHYDLWKSKTIILMTMAFLLTASCRKDLMTAGATDTSTETVARAATPPIGQIITLQGNDGDFVSGENGTVSMTCTRGYPQAWEDFLVVDAGGGKVALKSMNKYVSSENGTMAITCNRTTFSTWEEFTWIANSNGTITLQGSNGKYISSENGVQAMSCSRTPASTWEQFVVHLASPSALKSLSYLYSISGTKTVAGQQAMQYWQPMDDVTGKYPSLWGEDFSFQPFQGTTTMDGWRSLIVTTAEQRWNSGALVGLMMHACPPTQAEPCQWSGGVESSLTDAQWTDLITNGGTLNNNWKARLDIIATYLQTLKNNGVEVLFRPFHEMNQPVFWWAGRPGPNGTAKLYQITHDYLVNTKGLTNLIWVWNLQDFSTLSTDLTNYNPGGSYWDMLALDIYESDGTGFTTAKYNAILNIAGNKPIAIGECGVLPTSATLTSQPRWTYFLGWADLTQSDNSNSTISTLYNSGNVVTLDRKPAW